RVARCVAAPEKKHNPKENLKKLEEVFYGLMARREFIPNSPTLMNAGKENGQLSACFVIPVEDSMEGIFDSIKNAALIHKTGGGTGFAFSRLRPSNDVVLSTHGVASGPVSFMTVFDSATEAVKQGGTRRGANMGILRVDHPDVVKFITCKYDNARINNFNISVALTEEFMTKVKNNEDYDLINPKNNQVFGQQNARKVFNLIVNMAWKNGDPGIIFLDRINKDNPTPNMGEMESTNPCGEQPLLPYEACNLGSLNLSLMLKKVNDKNTVDYSKLRRTVHSSIHFLDNVIDANFYPLPEIDAMVKTNRKIGLGIMGYADMLIDMGLPYDSEEALELGEEVMNFINKEAKIKSMEIAKSKGAFPNFKESIYGEAELPENRNSTVTTIAPTGTISIIANSSSGIEPIFAVSYFRNVMDNDILVEVNPKFESIAKERGFFSEELMAKIAEQGSIQDIEEIPEDVKKVFRTSHDISPDWHIRTQAAFQQHTDNAVSKTVNFSHDATAEDIAEAYMLAYELGCKGVTVFRDGCRDSQVLNIGGKKGEAEGTDAEADGIEATGDRVEGVVMPRSRGKFTFGRTEKMVTADGTLYITINQDEFGLCEVFTNIGKHGSDVAAWSEAVGRLISLCLRSGIDLKSLIQQLRGITSTPIWQEGEQILSVPDAIGRALSRYLEENNMPASKLSFTTPDFNQEGDSPETASIPSDTVRVKHATCPDCGTRVEFEGGCVVCRSCGFSKCG
ncbi:MAG: vitamin B12-dependent ribonucleotide reductase, partial [bacterium]|nr:vitamin B12-dependent ribonucleotide reductase [bacterium]